MKTQTKILWLLIVIITFFALSAKGQHIGIENAMLEIQDSYTEKYDSNQYVRANEFQELKQELNDKKAEYKRQIMIHVLARFCTFMSPEKAAIEAVRYSEALLKELEN